MSLAIVDARVLTLAGARTDDHAPRPAPRMGPHLRELGVLPRATVLIEGETIAAVAEGEAGAELAARAGPARVIEAEGRVLMPGFVDCHTHACWAGDRLDEWDMRRRGAGYLEILKAGGGIMSTVRAVRAASEDELAAGLLARLRQMLRGGTTTVEVKSGYGLSPADELKMLRAIRGASAQFAGTVVATALLGHALDPEAVAARGEDGFVDWMVKEALPAVSSEFPGIAVDAFCEEGAWSAEQCQRLFEAALAAGHPVRVHADQFTSKGMTSRAVDLGAASVDHLEASGEEELRVLARSERTFGVMLPICGLHLDERYARGRIFVDAAPASKLAIATNLNPGSAPSGSMPLAIGLAVRKCGLMPTEAIAAATVNPACLLGFADRGAIAPGLRADVMLLNSRDERDLAYGMGFGAVAAVVCGGRVVEGMGG